MKGLEIKIFFQRHRKIIVFITIIVLAVLILLGLERIDIDVFVRNSTMFGVIGTLLGAVVGGSFYIIRFCLAQFKATESRSECKKKKCYL